MKYLLFAVLISAAPFHSFFIPKSALVTDELIVIEDDVVLLTCTGDENENIIDIDITSTSSSLEEATEEVEGCFQPTCRTDISHLSAGNYLVTVSTDAGNSFSGTVTKH